jgi:hypothetical protein
MMRVRRWPLAASVVITWLFAACAPDESVTVDPNADDEPPWPIDASIDDEVGPRPEVDGALAQDDLPPLADDAPRPPADAGSPAPADARPPPIDVPATPVDAPPAPMDTPPTPVDVGTPTPVVPEQRCRVESTTYAAAMVELDVAPGSTTRLRFTLPGIPAGVTAATLHYDSFDADHPNEEGVIALNGRRFQMPANPAWDNVTMRDQTVDVSGAVAAGNNVVEFGPGPLPRTFYRVGRVALEFTARVERCPGVAAPMPVPTDAGAPAGPVVERTIGYRAATYTQRGNWVFRCDANYAYTARGDHGSEDCTGGYAPDGTLRGTATFTFANVTAATYDVLIGSRHSPNRNTMLALFIVNGEANRIDQRTGDGALAIVTDTWGRRALAGTVRVVLDTTRNSGSDSVSFVTLRPVR